MELAFFGHAAVGIESRDGTRLLVDPFETGGLAGAITYDSIRWEADWVLCTHDHADHSAVGAVAGRPKRVGERVRVGPFEIGRFPFDHDEYDGERFGGSVDVVSISVDGYRIVHASDVGQSAGGSLPAELREPDVLFVPTGGFYTAGPAQAFEWVRRVRAQCVVPTHYDTAGIELPLFGLEAFLAYFDDSIELGSASLRIPDELPERRGVCVVMDPLCVPSVSEEDR